MCNLQNTNKELSTLAQEYDSILVSYSGGKDSRVVLDLCTQYFKQVICFFMFFVPDLEYDATNIKWAQDTYHVQVLQYPHWNFIRCLAEGVYKDENSEWDEVSGLRLRDIYDLVMTEAGCRLIATGQKRADYIGRSAVMHQIKAIGRIVHPLEYWNKQDVLGYLRDNQIGMPDNSNHITTGIDLSTPSLLWLHDEHPNDFIRLLKYFPYAESVVWRREFYGKDAV